MKNWNGDWDWINILGGDFLAIGLVVP